MKGCKWLRRMVVALGIVVVGDVGTSWGQTYVVVPQGRPRAMRRMARGNVVAVQPGVLPAFSARGGIGTTPYLGNTRGMGAYSTNYGFGRQGMGRGLRRWRAW